MGTSKCRFNTPCTGARLSTRMAALPQLLRGLTQTSSLLLFFFNDTATTEIYTLSLHDALPICMQFVKDEKTLATTDGSFIVQTYVRSQPSMSVTAVKDGDFQSRDSTEIQPMGRGYEHVLEGKLVENAPMWASNAVEKLSAKPVEVGRYDLVLHPSHLALTIHESIGHPTELDRAMGYEANYAGTSFIAPPADFLGKFRYGPDFMNVQGDRSQEGSLAQTGWDDEGVKPDDFMIVKNGIFNDYQTTREQAMWLDWWYKQKGEPTRS